MACDVNVMQYVYRSSVGKMYSITTTGSSRKVAFSIGFCDIYVLLLLPIRFGIVYEELFYRAGARLCVCVCVCVCVCERACVHVCLCVSIANNNNGNF